MTIRIAAKIAVVMTRRGRDSRKPQEKEAIRNKVVHHQNPAHPQTAISTSWSIVPSLCTGHVLQYGISLWPVQVSCLGCALSGTLVDLLTCRA